MQRAIWGSLILGTTGGLLGSLVVLRQLSFFGDALGHSALLGISLGLLLGLSPQWTLLPFSLLLGLVIMVLLSRAKLWPDAMLNIVYSTSLALAVIILSFIDQYKGGLSNFLFGDILAIQPSQLYANALLLVVCLGALGLTLRQQMLLTLNRAFAQIQGVPVERYQIMTVMLLSLVVALSIQMIGVLLVSAFLVIPPCTARLLSDRFTLYVPLSIGLGGASALIGVLLSALLDLPSGPTIVLVQFMAFLGAMVLPRSRSSARA
ncbi:MAG: metal ABC transporter permease [Synechococcales cyanobacterium RM1_1_8]|nr:metal ABC transporter permease [Synechococcales cyanobacterium RM1_1_8]